MNKSKRTEPKYIYRNCCGIILTVITAATFYYAWYKFVVVNNQTGHLTGLGNLGMAVLIYVLLYALIARWLHGFKIGVERKASVLAGQVLTLFVVDAAEVFISCAITGQFRFFGRFFFEYLELFIIQSVIVFLLIIPMINTYRKVFPPLEIIEIFGDYQNQLCEKINSVPYKYHVSKMVSCHEPKDLIIREIQDYDAVLINDLPATEKNEMLKICFDMDKRVYFVPKLSDVIVKGSEELNLFDTPLFLSRNIGISPLRAAIKRVFDVVLSTIALILLSPVFLITAVAIKKEDGGPVFFRQERVTKGGRRFMILKFRSMIVDAEKDGRPHPAGEKDDRITRVGHVIRACRVDELPQLINILKGDMSIVGPRPERWEHVEKYTREIPEFTFRSKVKGGLTGYAQVYGKYNTSALDKLKLDLLYITNYSFLMDIQIIFETVKILFQKESTEGFTEEKVEEMHDAVQHTDS